MAGVSFEGEPMAELHTLDRKLWLTADGDRVVEDGDPAAAFLLGGAGDQIEMGEAVRLGLTKPKRAEKQAVPAEDKQVDAPANKGRRSRKAKG